MPLFESTSGTGSGRPKAPRRPESLARDTGQPVWTNGAAVQEARTAALRGDVDVALHRATEVELDPATRGINDFLAGAQLARGMALIAAGRHADAYAALPHPFHPRRLRIITSASNSVGSWIWPKRPCTATSGRERWRILARMETIAAVTDSPVLATQLLYARPVLAEARRSRRAVSGGTRP